MSGYYECTVLQYRVMPFNRRGVTRPLQSCPLVLVPPWRQRCYRGQPWQQRDPRGSAASGGENRFYHCHKQLNNVSYLLYHARRHADERLQQDRTAAALPVARVVYAMYRNNRHKEKLNSNNAIGVDLGGREHGCSQKRELKHKGQPSRRLLYVHTWYEEGQHTAGIRHAQVSVLKALGSNNLSVNVRTVWLFTFLYRWSLHFRTHLALVRS